MTLQPIVYISIYVIGRPTVLSIAAQHSHMTADGQSGAEQDKLSISKAT